MLPPLPVLRQSRDGGSLQGERLRADSECLAAYSLPRGPAEQSHAFELSPGSTPPLKK